MKKRSYFLYIKNQNNGVKFVVSHRLVTGMTYMGLLGEDKREIVARLQRNAQTALVKMLKK